MSHQPIKQQDNITFEIELVVLKKTKMWKMIDCSLTYYNGGCNKEQSSFSIRKDVLAFKMTIHNMFLFYKVHLFYKGLPLEIKNHLKIEPTNYTIGSFFIKYDPFST